MSGTAKTRAEAVQYLLDKALPKAGGCLISHLATNKKGYVPYSLGGRKGKKVRAHRMIYEELHGDLLPEELVLHSCNVRNCIAPDHLYVGDAQTNTNDMMYAGRNRNQTTAKVLGYVSTKSI